MMRMLDKISWDGSYLNSYTGDVILESIDEFPYKSYNIFLEDCMLEPIWVNGHTSKNKYPCIVDEIAVILGIPKIGTHSLKINGKLYIIYNTKNLGKLRLPQLGDDTLINETKMLVQDVFVFRMIMGFNDNCESCILMRGIKPMSYRNKIDINYDNRFYISNLTMKKWFVDTPRKSIIRMVSHSVRSLIMRGRIQDVINLIDHDLIWVEGVIYNRMSSL